ncbi:beta-N-acetylhexosaminidase [Pleomorphovibrio marinus]|uniref:beta-N-acetylhexosaminidase n=1 Tax=Pleomorphovibrio marinus TaxID=2164132 RepID=UPI000E0BEE7A|nr:beta-N-acetylhexosaminidase [Pleomorphovibrio marinus]
MNGKLLLIAYIGCFMSHLLYAQEEPSVQIIPYPKSLTLGEGNFVLSPHTTVLANTEGGRQSLELFNAFFEKRHGFSLTPATVPQEGLSIHLEEETLKDSEEAYSLSIQSDQITIKGGKAGIFYGLQSLLQLVEENQGTLSVPVLQIEDEPAFGYRGIMLDVARHFFPVEQIKKIIDLMGHYKFNRLHWHLTEDQGWRIEIKKYPKLTSFSAWRDSTIIGQYYDFDPFIYDGKKHGGYYTQEEAREIVRYASDRNITVIPEIELPGHSSAVLAAYPELGSFEVKDGKALPGKIEAKNEKGEPYDNTLDTKVPGHWGVHKNIYGPTEKAFRFLEDVLTEIMEIFPSTYIHIGGDEVPKDHWITSEAAQKLIKKEKLEDEHELQSFFIRRIETFLNKNGRKLIGWDEILEGGLAPNATVMSWRGEKGGIAAAKMGHDVIMTPNSHLYFDHYQGEDKSKEPLAIGGFLPLEKVYSYSPIPADLDDTESQHVLGVQANLWTEYIPTNNKMEYFLFPRALALAEVAWRAKEDKDYGSFSRDRLPRHLRQLERDRVFFRIPEAQVSIEKDEESGRHRIAITPLVDQALVFYTVDGHKADPTGTPYRGPFLAPIPGEGQGPLSLRYVVVTPNGRSSNEFQVEVK